MRIRVKICGITDLDDALVCVESGADAIGFIFWEKSPRYIDPVVAGHITKRIPPFVTTVGVFVDEKEKEIKDIIKEAGLCAIQLHGKESPSFCKRFEGIKVIKAFRVRDERSVEDIGEYDVSAYLLDTFTEGKPGGTGRVFDWEIAKKVKEYGRIILSGGLTPENVEDAVSAVQPYGVDVCSGVESRPGKKDPVKISQFVELVRRFKP